MTLKRGDVVKNARYRSSWLGRVDLVDGEFVTFSEITMDGKRWEPFTRSDGSDPPLVAMYAVVEPAAAGGAEPPRDVPNCRDRTCSGAMYERNAATANATALADARGECATLERKIALIRDEAALEIAWLKRELRRNDPRLYNARYGRSSPTGGAEK